MLARETGSKLAQTNTYEAEHFKNGMDIVMI